MNRLTIEEIAEAAIEAYESARQDQFCGGNVSVLDAVVEAIAEIIEDTQGQADDIR